MSVLTVAAIARARKLFAATPWPPGPVPYSAARAFANTCADEIIRGMFEADLPKYLRQLRHRLHYRRGKPVDHARPWVKYANRPRLGRPSDFTHTLGVARLDFGETIAKLFGIDNTKGPEQRGSRK